MAARGETLVRAYMTALNDDDDALYRESVSGDFELIEAPALPGAAHLRGADALERYWREAQLGRVALDADPHRGGRGPRPAPGRPVAPRATHTGIALEKRWWYVFTVADGRLVRQQSFDSNDEAGARTAFHAGPPPG